MRQRDVVAAVGPFTVQKVPVAIEPALGAEGGNTASLRCKAGKQPPGRRARTADDTTTDAATRPSA